MEKNMTGADYKTREVAARIRELRLIHGLSEEEKEDHPARFALVDLINIYDDGLLFEPIHRVLFGVSPEAFLKKLLHELKESGAVLTDKDSKEKETEEEKSEEDTED